MRRPSEDTLVLPTHLAPVCVCLAAFALYAATPVAVHRFDAAGYMLASQAAAPQFSPHHLLYMWLAWLVRHVVGPGRTVAVMQTLSTMCAAVALGLYCKLLQDVLREASVWWAVLGAALLGLSSSFWISAGETDPYAITLVCVIAATACYLRAAERDALAWHVLAGLAVATATLVHQLVAVYTLVYVLGLALGRVRRPLVCATTFLIPAAAVPAATYLAIAVGQGFGRDVARLLRWLTEDARSGYWGVFHRDNIVQGLYGFLYAVAAGAGGLASPAVVRASAVVMLLVGGYAVARQLRSAASGRERALGAFLVVWIVLYVPFILWWAPFHSVHWQFVLVPLIILGAWTAARLAPASRLALVAAALVVALVGAVNYVRVVWPLTLPENDRARVFVGHALATLPGDARVVAPIGVGTNAIAARLGPGSVFIVPHAVAMRATHAQVLAALRAFVESAWAEGRSVWVFGSLLEPPRGRLSDPVFKAEVRGLLERLGVQGRLRVLPTDVLDQPMRRHPWDLIGT